MGKFRKPGEVSAQVRQLPETTGPASLYGLPVSEAPRVALAPAQSTGWAGFRCSDAQPHHETVWSRVYEVTKRVREQVKARRRRPLEATRILLI